MYGVINLSLYMDVAILNSVLYTTSQCNYHLYHIPDYPNTTSLRQFFKNELMCDSGIKIIVVYVTCHQRYKHWGEEKIEMYRILWMTVNSNWSLRDNGFSSEMYLIKDHDI